MTIKTTVGATAVALLAGTVCFAVQAEARDQATPAGQTRVWTSHGNKRLYMSAAAIYDAGVERGSARASRNAYLRGFRDGTSTAAYTPRQYIVDSAPVYSGAPVYSAAPAYGYSTYSRDVASTPAIAGYSYDGGTVALGDSYASGYGYRQYSAGPYSGGPYNAGEYNAAYAPRGLMDVAVAPVVVAQPLEAQNTRWSSCAARYGTFFDPVSGTFLAADGHRYYCR
jgi:hypothetical protein